MGVCPSSLPVVIIMAGLILWPFVNALLSSLTVRSFVTGQEQFVGVSETTSGCGATADYRKLDKRHGVVLPFFSLAVKFVVGLGIALLLNSRLPFRNVLTGVHAPALDCAGGGHGPSPGAASTTPFLVG